MVAGFHLINLLYYKPSIHGYSLAIALTKSHPLHSKLYLIRRKEKHKKLRELYFQAWLHESDHLSILSGGRLYLPEKKKKKDVGRNGI